MKLASLIATFLLCVTAFAQKADIPNRKAEPKGGMAAVAIVYYKIDLDNWEVEYLRAHEAELIFMINEQGKAVLEKVNDIGMKSIVDKMMRVNDQLPGFLPEIVNGKEQSAVYFMRLKWPHYAAIHSMPKNDLRRFQTVNHKLDEFDSMTFKGPRFDWLMGGNGIAALGNAAKYNHPGGGMKTEIMLFNKKGWGAGMVAGAYGNRSKSYYPVTSVIPPLDSRTLLFVGAGIGKTFTQKGRGHFIVQFEPLFMMQTIVAGDHELDIESIDTKGLSPGVSVNYVWQLGQGRVMGNLYRASVLMHALNFNVTARPVFFDFKHASGLIMEAGVSYRMITRDVEKLKLK